MVVDFQHSSITATEISGFMSNKTLSGRSDNGNDQGMIIRILLFLLRTLPAAPVMAAGVAYETAVWHRRGNRDSV
jgi:hypothetical protein